MIEVTTRNIGLSEITANEFDTQVRCLRNVAIKSSIVGSARLTSYYKGKQVVGMVRNYRGYTTYFKNDYSSRGQGE